MVLSLHMTKPFVFKQAVTVMRSGRRTTTWSGRSRGADRSHCTSHAGPAAPGGGHAVCLPRHLPAGRVPDAGVTGRPPPRGLAGALPQAGPVCLNHADARWSPRERWPVPGPGPAARLLSLGFPSRGPRWSSPRVPAACLCPRNTAALPRALSTPRPSVEAVPALPPEPLDVSLLVGHRTGHAPREQGAPFLGLWAAALGELPRPRPRPAGLWLGRAETLTCTHFTLMPGHTNFLQIRLALLSPQVMGYKISASRFSPSSVTFTSHRGQGQGEGKRARQRVSPSRPSARPAGAQARRQQPRTQSPAAAGRRWVWPDRTPPRPQGRRPGP